MSGAAVLWLVEPILLTGLGAALLGLVPALAPAQRVCSCCAEFLAEVLAANTAVVHIGHAIYLRKHLIAFKRAAQERIFVTKPVLGVGRKRNLAHIPAAQEAGRIDIQ